MNHPLARPWLWLMCAFLIACGQGQKDELKSTGDTASQGVILTVGSVFIKDSDLAHQIKESHGGRMDEVTRTEVLNQLADRARMVQAALDAGLLDDTIVRSEFGRILSSRFREKELIPQLREIEDLEIPESRLREVYSANLSRYQSNEKRQVAVLWLNPGKDPQREKQYIEKLNAARDWFFENQDLKNSPEQGFSTLAVDHSEHQASRYVNGIAGWFENDTGPDGWTRAVSRIAFALAQPGDVSDVIAGDEGVFLVRYVGTQPAVTRSFESVATELARAEKKRLQQTAETDFKTTLEGKYPVHWITH